MDAALPSRVSRFPLRAALVTTALLALAVVSYAAYVRYTTQQQPAAPQAAIPVRKAPIAQTVSTTGQVAPRRQAKLAPAATGLIKELPVALGQRVQAGQVLARLDTTTLDIKLSQARSALRTAELKLQQLRAGPRAEDVAAAQAAVDSAQAKLAELQGGAPAAELAQAAAAAEHAAAGIRSAQAKLQQVQSGPTAADRAQAEQAVAAAQSTLQKAEADLAKAQTGPTADEIRQAELAVEQARNSLWAQQISRDQACGRAVGCEAANAQVAAAETAVTKANEALAVLKRGPDPLAVRTAQSAVDSAREALRAAQTKLEQLRSGATAEDVGQARAAVESAQAGHASAVAKLDAVRQGPKSAEVAAAQATLVQAQSQLALKKAPATTSEIALAEEAVESARLQLRQAEVDLAGATLVAPFEGVVGALQANAGEPVGGQGGGALLTLVDPAAARVDVAVDESDIAKLGPEKPARITFDALPDKRYSGKVVGISPNAAVNQGVATYTVSVSIDDADAAVQPGMTANVQVVVAEKPDALVVPNRAIRRIGGKPFVEVAGGEMRVVQTGIAAEQLTEITSGLQEGDQVLLPLPTGAAAGTPNKMTFGPASAVGAGGMKGEVVMIKPGGP